jgi:hypothetical protein
MLESRASRLLATFVDDSPRRIDPLDFTALLQLKDQGYVDVTIAEGKVVAARTSKAKAVIKCW